MARQARTEFDHPPTLDTSSDPEAFEVVAPLVSLDESLSPYPRPKLIDLPGGKRLLEKDPAWNRRCLLALAAIAGAWQDRYEQVIATTTDQIAQLNYHHRPGGMSVLSAFIKIEEISTALLRRKLPLDRDDMRTLLEVASRRSSGWSRFRFHMPGLIVHLERLAEAEGVVESLTPQIRKLRAYLDLPGQDRKLATRLDRLLETEGDEVLPLRLVADVPGSAAVGSDLIHRRLKAFLGLPLGPVEGDEALPVEPDGFAAPAASPLREAHAVIGHALSRQSEDRRHRRDGVDLLIEEVGDLGELTLGQAEALSLALDERVARLLLPERGEFDDYHLRGSLENMRHGIGLDVAGPAKTLEDLLLLTASRAGYWARVGQEAVAFAEAAAAAGELSPGMQYFVHRLRCIAISEPPMGTLPPLAARLSRLLDGDATMLLVPGERWADRAHADLAAMTDKQRAAWVALLRHAYTATSSKPSAAWTKEAKAALKLVTAKHLRRQLAAWFPEVARGRSFRSIGSYGGDSRSAADTFNDGNANVLRGLVWTLAAVPDADTPRLLADLLTTSIKKVPGVGPRAVKLANACVWALGETAGHRDAAVQTASLGQLARLKSTVTFKTTLKMIDKALAKAAERLGTSPEELEEMAVPTYGMEEVGRRVEELGDFTAELVVTGTGTAELRWKKADGSAQKSVPKAVKEGFADELKELKAAAKDIAKMLPAQRDRLDLLPLRQKAWDYTTWAERYLDHPLVGTLARRLIWTLTPLGSGDDTEADAAVMWLDGRLVGVDGEPVGVDPAATRVALWHPIGRGEAEVLAWRRFVEDRRIRQPFKQAHREVYLLTDAERNTAVYSNRFAAHLIKQHQFNALCGVRGWRNKLRLMVDDEYPPATRELPAWDLRAEFWVEGAGDDFGTDTTDSGSYLYLATDQVRFYPLGSSANSAHAGGGGYAWSRWRGEDAPEPIPLEDVPPLVLSEVMRDVDLFVGVASVGNDPAWQDGGRQQRYGHAGYWADYSFGDLSATATTRRGVLERLVPRLKIADRCSFTDRFLVVRGDLRTYHIHLGSGNIQMEPNNQYLCIVPGRGEGVGASGGGASGGGASGGVFLPFEGDRTMSIILSKAFLLADDRAITDPTIVSQIRRGS